MRARAAAALAIAIGLLVAACGAGPEVVETITTTSSEPTTPPTTLRSELIPGSTAACASPDPWESVETAFEGTISSIVIQPNSDRESLYLELGEDPSEIDWPWVTFEVTGWFSRDFGTEFSMWAPGFTGVEGERWLVAGSLYGSQGRQSGEVFPCLSVAASTEAEAAFVERFGDPIVAGSGTPEKPADPTVVADIEEHEAIWEAAGIDDYTAVISVYEGNQVFEDSCGANTSVRVVVRDGEPVQAIDLQRFCEVEDLAGLVMVDDLFALAVANAGALQERIGFDEESGVIRYFYASDRSVEAGASVEMFIPRPLPAALGSGTSMAELANAHDRWEQAGIDDYTLDLDVICFCTIGGRFQVVVEDGVPVSVTQDGSEVDIEGYDFIEFTVDGLFALAQTWGGGEEPDRMAASFDPDLGYPVDLRIDAIEEAIDDEVTVVVHDFAIGE